MTRLFAPLLLVGISTHFAPPAAADDQLYRPGEVSTAAAEVRIGFSPDGQWAAWGTIGRESDPEQQDIWLSRRGPEGWSPPFPVPFNTSAVEFDPAFSPDGRMLYFHSDRDGGLGGTDLYGAAFDSATGPTGAPVNLGDRVNSQGDEWAPLPTPWGTLIFASDGWGGEGGMDLFEATFSGADGTRPRNLGPAVNTSLLDFDAALAGDGLTLIFSSGPMGQASAVSLFQSRRQSDGDWSPRRPIAVGCSSFAIGPGFDPSDPGSFYYSANCEDGIGRMDIRKVEAARLQGEASPGAEPDPREAAAQRRP